MPRDLPQCPAGPPREVHSHGDLELFTYRFQTITPTYGGGVEAGSIEMDRPVRATSIRGHLRFWWRATRGARFATVDELRREEGRVWGTTESPSPVKVLVRVARPAKQQRFGQPREPFGFRNFAPEMYALFPTRDKEGSRDGGRASLIREGLEFDVTVSWPRTADLRSEVETALRAWANLGGIGARTRRGLGAIYCEQLALVQIRDAKDWLMEARDDTPVAPRPWAVLSADDIIYQTKNSNQTPLDAWRDALELLRRYRQDAGYARNPGQAGSRPGRSRWPEPETIRRTTNQRDPKHEEFRDHPDGFPRAALGLPIIFHFQSRLDPPDTALSPIHEGKKYDRMASPILTRALRLAGGETLAVVTRLLTPALGGVVLEWSGGSRRFGPEFVADQTLGGYRDAPLKSGSSALERFPWFASEQGWELL